ncbi:MAG: adenylate/guanylate cyclase domain-containing protein [Gemmatimonadetes bacterium]|nr:adenylate/guanylate cyclase domain-containing protein [Gemmatimonadota bacterium]NIO30854.1 adenylate/guanylate cyclase domain-containing protein [Gemmatimonadota bacterium]
MIEESRVVFAHQFDREVSESERLRVTLLGAVFALALAFWIVAAVAFPELFERVFHGKLNLTWVFGFLSVALSYELGARILIGHFIRTGQRLPPLARYGNAFVEVSIPTAMLIVYAQVSTPATVLLSPWTFVYFVLILLSALRLDFKLCYFTGLVAAVEYTVLALVLVGGGRAGSVEPMLVEPIPHVAKGLILLSAGIATGFVTREIQRRVANALRTVEDRNRVIGIFGQHVSPAVVDTLLKQGADVEEEIRHVCIMFLDIRDFTAFAERRGPEEMVSYLNNLYGFMTEIVNRNHGMINKFLGDGFMAVFGAPLSESRDSQNAISAASEIVDRVQAESVRGTIPETRLGIGLHAGDVMIGTVGSALRKEYTIIGDVVNTASRIEQLNKRFDSQILASSEVWDAAEGSQEEAVYLGEVLVEGREEPVGIYRLA